MASPNMNKAEVVQAIKSNLPKELLSQSIWLAYYYQEKPNGSFSKPPVRGYSVDADKPSFSFEEVIQDGFPGIKINDSHQYIGLDIDDKEAKEGKCAFTLDRIPKPTLDFLRESGTYTEISPSGCGIRSIFRYVGEKKGLPGRVNLRKDLFLGGELFTTTGYVTITGDKVFGDKIADIDANTMASWYQSKEKQPKPTEAAADSAVPPTAAPSIQEVKVALDACRLDQSEVIVKAYETIVGQTYSHYDYWLRIMAACHHYASVSGRSMQSVFSLVVDWCKTDPSSFVSEEDVLNHWESFDRGEGEVRVTYNTLFKFARLTRFKWPKERMFRGSPTGKPRTNEYANFEYILDYYSVEVHHEVYTNALYVSADPTILKNYFSGENVSVFFGRTGPFSVESFTGRVWRLLQDNHYDNISHGSISPHAKVFVEERSKSFNLLADWLATPYEDLPPEIQEPGTFPECSSIDYLLECFKFEDGQSIELAEIYFRAFFSGVVMPIYNPNRLWPEHNFMLILSGPENCRKTSFFSSIFPRSLASRLITHSMETLSSTKSLRDFNIQLSSSAVLVVDEFEIFYNPANDSLFKSLVTSSSVEFIPIYSSTTKKAERTAALAGTTNKDQLPIEQNSSRRLALVGVKYIDTDKMSKINWHFFYNKFVKKGKRMLANGEYPWKLTQEQIELQYAENEKFRTRNDLEIMLTEAFDFTHEFPGLHVIKRVQGPYNESPRYLFSLRDVQSILLNNNPRAGVKASAVKRTLERMCGAYTGTFNLQKDLTQCKGTIKNGVARQGQIARYVLPPIITNFEAEGS